MNKKDKLLRKLCSYPKDFSFEEMTAVFSACGFEINNKGRTSGSRIEFVNSSNNDSYIMHKPHPNNIIKGYVMKQVVAFLKAKGYIE
jgi:hypothetical protein